MVFIRKVLDNSRGLNIILWLCLSKVITSSSKEITCESLYIPWNILFCLHPDSRLVQIGKFLLFHDWLFSYWWLPFALTLAKTIWCSFDWPIILFYTVPWSFHIPTAKLLGFYVKIFKFVTQPRKIQNNGLVNSI